MSEIKSTAYNKIQLAKTAYEKAVATESNKIKEELFEALETASTIFTALKELNINAWSEPKYDVLLTNMGLNVHSITEKPTKTKVVTGRKRVNDAEILKAIGEEEVSPTELSEKLGVGYQTTTKKLKQLAATKVLSVRKDGLKMLYKVK